MDCTSLVQDIDLNYSNLTNNSSPRLVPLKFELNNAAILNPNLSFNQPSFQIILLVLVSIAIIISCVLAYYVYPKYDKQQKLIKLRVQYNIQPQQKYCKHYRTKVEPYLDEYTKNNRDINNIILNYANIENTKWLFNFVSSIIGQKPFWYFLVQFITISSFLIASYFQFYWIISHWNDSYKSYIEAQCYPYSGKEQHFYYYYHQINMNQICDNNYNNILFYVDITLDGEQWEHKFNKSDVINLNTSSSVPCYIHDEEFTVRAPNRKNQKCVRCGQCCQCCGRCHSVECYCCDMNCCCYAVCIITILSTLLCLLCFIGTCYCCSRRQLFDNWNDIHIDRDAIDRYKKDNDCLLIVKENDAYVNTKYKGWNLMYPHGELDGTNHDL